MFKPMNHFEAYEYQNRLYLFIKDENMRIIYARDGLEKEEGMLSLLCEVLKRYSLETSGVLALTEGMDDKENAYIYMVNNAIRVADEHHTYCTEKTPEASKEFSDKNFYFTFNKDEKTQMPYHDAYLIVRANNIYTALDLYQINHPNVHTGIINCSYYFGYPEWEKEISKHWVGQEPKEIITAQSTYEKYGRVEYGGSDADRESFEEER